MTPEEIHTRIAAINPGDPETAHSEEGDIHYDALTAIADDESAPQHVRNLALASMATVELDFPRWCA